MDDTTNLTARVWDAPSKPYHLKSVRFSHYKGHRFPDERAYICHKCGGTVVYTTSASGRRYLCDAVKRSSKGFSYGSYDFRIYYPNLWHSKSCVAEWDGTIHRNASAYIARVARLHRQEAEREASRAEARAPETPSTDAEWQELAEWNAQEQYERTR